MKWRHVLRFSIAASLAGVGGIASSCSDDPPPIVATPRDASPDADPSCPCAPVEWGVPLATGQIPLPCYCGKSDWPADMFGGCRPYDALLSCPIGIPYVYVETYSNCNLVKIGYAGFSNVDFNVYDATTRELVGAMRGKDDEPALTCNGRGANLIAAGMIPGPECEVKAFEEPCWPADAGDGGPPGERCGCSSDNEGVVRWNDLSCLCGSSSSRACPSYDAALTICAAPASYEFDLVETHESCNLVVVKVGAGINRFTYVYDATTHAMVGTSFASTVNVIRCGSKRVAEYRAGIFPPADCAVTQTARRCPRDGGRP
jgi:hypothetical protein